MPSEEITKALKKCGLFSQLSEEELSPIADLGSIENYAAGDMIYRQGDIGEKLFILSEGQVSLNRNFEIGNNRQAEKVVYILRESPNRRLMGSWSTLVGEQHIQMCSAKCNIPTKVVSFSCSELRDLISKNKNIRIKILQKLIIILRERLESSYSSMEIL
ncbi:MAG: cyclic nucleotide-binding domain-containing protein [Deltaproteobacteria bacterium]|nr:cyclic nucleotide-binding domain-containing protein [Deltaproteobacteria bacterium]